MKTAKKWMKPAKKIVNLHRKNPSTPILICTCHFADILFVNDNINSKVNIYCLICKLLTMKVFFYVKTLSNDINYKPSFTHLGNLRLKQFQYLKHGTSKTPYDTYASKKITRDPPRPR